MSPSNSSSPYMKMIQYEIKMIKVRTAERRDAAPAADFLVLTGPSGKINNKRTGLISCKMSKTLVQILTCFMFTLHLKTKTLFFLQISAYSH